MREIIESILENVRNGEYDYLSDGILDIPEKLECSITELNCIIKFCNMVQLKSEPTILEEPILQLPIATLKDYFDITFEIDRLIKKAKLWAYQVETGKNYKMVITIRVWN